MELNGILGLIEQYGLPLILLLGAIYALYRFRWRLHKLIIVEFNIYIWLIPYLERKNGSNNKT